MTVNTTNISAGPFEGNGVAVSFSFTFRVDEPGQLRVLKTDVAGVQSLLALTTDYTVTGLGEDTGGNVVLTNGPLLDDEILFIRANYQETQLIPFQSQGAFFPDLHESAIDKLTFLVQQLRYTLGRSIGLSDDDPAQNLNLRLPTPEANSFLAWDSDATALTNIEAFSGIVAVASEGVLGLVERLTNLEFDTGLDATRYPTTRQIHDKFQVKLPVDSIHLSLSAANPSTYFGYGTWQALSQGRALVGAGSHNDGASTETFTAGSTRGTYEVTIGPNQMPSHTHTVTDPGHLHRLVDNSGNSPGDAMNRFDSNDSTDSPGTTVDTTVSTTGISLGATGGGDGHNNIQPSFAVYIWVRTA